MKNASLRVLQLILLALACRGVIDLFTGNSYPEHIPLFPVRLDSKTGKPVQRGLFEGIAGFHADRQKGISRLSFKEFTEALQCASNEPAVHQRMQFINAIPYTKKSLKLMLIHAETHCSPWKECHKYLEADERGEYSSDIRSFVMSSPTQARLLRVVSNRLYLDYPWEPQRFNDVSNHLDSLVRLLRMVEVGDAVWLHGDEFVMMDYKVPMPFFVNSPDVKSAGLVWPWHQDFKHEQDLYHKLREAHRNPANKDEYVADFSDEMVENVTKKGFLTGAIIPWEERIPKAAFYGCTSHIRQLYLDWADRWPDQVVAGSETFREDVEPWNPMATTSNRDLIRDNMKYKHHKDAETVAEAETSPLGTLESYHMHEMDDRILEYWLQYKYVAVLIGGGGFSAADRLGYFLAHSGAVVLLQAPTEFLYSFSPRLQPWVHYIPLELSMVDVGEKVRWLQENDDLARRIVENARNFGKSYLRLEDHYCYIARAVQAVAELSNHSDVVEPFHPVKQLWDISASLTKPGHRSRSMGIEVRGTRHRRRMSSDSAYGASLNASRYRTSGVIAGDSPKHVHLRQRLLI